MTETMRIRPVHDIALVRDGEAYVVFATNQKARLKAQTIADDLDLDVDWSDGVGAVVLCPEHAADFGAVMTRAGLAVIFHTRSSLHELCERNRFKSRRDKPMGHNRGGMLMSKEVKEEIIRALMRLNIVPPLNPRRAMQ